MVRQFVKSPSLASMCVFLGIDKQTWQNYSDKEMHPEFTEVTAQAGEQAAHDVFSSGLAPTALVCATDTQALGAMAACRQAGLQVGVQIAVSGYGNTEAGAYAVPPLSTIEHGIVDNGRHLADMLLRVIAGEDPQAFRRIEPVQLIERASLCPGPLSEFR